MAAVAGGLPASADPIFRRTKISGIPTWSRRPSLRIVPFDDFLTSRAERHREKAHHPISPIDPPLINQKGTAKMAEQLILKGTLEGHVSFYNFLRISLPPTR